MESVDIAPTLARPCVSRLLRRAAGRVLGEAFSSTRRAEVSAQLEVSLCGIELRNPVLAASGTFAYGVEFEKLVDLNHARRLGGKGLSREPMEGNPPPRHMGSARRHDQLHRPAEYRRASVCARQAAGAGKDGNRGIRQCFRHMPPRIMWRWSALLEDGRGLAGYELNVSCPNTKHGGIYFSSDPALLARWLRPCGR